MHHTLDLLQNFSSVDNTLSFYYPFFLVLSVLPPLTFIFLMLLLSIYLFIDISPFSVMPGLSFTCYLLLLSHFHNPLDCAHLRAHPPHVPPPFASASHLSPSPAPCSSRLLLRTRAAVRSNLATREFWTKSVTTDIPAETRVISHPDNQHF